MPPRGKSPKRAAKSPAKPRPTKAPFSSPEPVRRTPRKTAGTTPARLGVTDDWGAGAAGAYRSDLVIKQAADQPAKDAARHAYIKELNANAGGAGIWSKYKSVMQTNRWLASSAQTAVLNVLSYYIAMQINATVFDLDVAVHWAVWGFVQTVLVLPYLDQLNARKFVKSSATLDVGAKAVFNQAFFTPLLTAVFLSYFALAQGSDPVTAVSYEKMTALAVPTACYWGTSDLVNLSIVPAEAQMLWNAVVGLVWTTILAAGWVA